MSRFDELPLSPEIFKGIRKIGFKEMTPIQIESIPLLLEGRDVIAQAQTGTGKTAAYSIPMLAQIDTDSPLTQGLVLAPTRELATQIASHIRRLAKYMEIRVMCFHGGGNVNRQISLLKHTSHIIVGTPGRIIDLSRKRFLDLNNVKYVVIDEADKMLEMGFIEEMRTILSQLPFVRQTSLWSATINDDILEISTRYMRQPRKVIVSREEIAQENVEQYIVWVEEVDRLKTLFEILNKVDVDRGFIFCNTRESVDNLTEKLLVEGYLVEALHGGLTQSERDQSFTKLLKRQVRFLVSTDVASRGIDIKGITHIINYEVPENPEIYFHRIGRTARIGEIGKSITLVSPEDQVYWEEIRNMTKTPIKQYII